mmetsp:Transcript_20136/g.19440  ORF Transcript_20136/g.19440 Transcript_20136/m.19440 type:complete len:838 (+) Transcript_20136:160-2673(+)|eukprot:CAMPEP_0119053594 /NCGR_PEP_ID=MMETSP1177-20130426/74524_1 /TAXON_ID=2985 /ORGANISM="Ochromonas sp, Strain CCMP1899" /LENGTH=837 /DNA_ID=CAMNT_0007033585 /DNA_START=100 /DNA_END=2613 /DNA_ORIENTATION=+
MAADGGGRNLEAFKRQFQEFLENDDHQGKYIEKLKECIQDKTFRLVVNINDIRNLFPDLAAKIIKRPREYIVALKEAASESAQNADPSVAKILKSRELQVGFEGNFGANSVSPRNLLSGLLNSLVEVEGIVTKGSSVRPKMVRSVQFCPATWQYSTLEHRDETDADIGIEVRGRVMLPTTGSLPKEDKDGNALELEQGLSTYKDYQTIILQEMPERAKVGQLPRSIELILEYDLVDRVKPGDRIQCVGVYQPLSAGMVQGQCSGFFKSVLICNNISVIGKEVGAVRLTGIDIGHIKEIASRPNVLECMADSLCPSIFGHAFIKKALILQLLSGVERNLENGTHLRGDINVMMVGDPSTAKSQLLRAILDIAPLAISTTGRGSSGVGLTAAVTMDAETGEKRLEAGAMVLADRGVVCIDEFDKMAENDRVAIHEVMEQQTVTIAKAGIHASLNARCSVLAAANPVYGQYDRSRRPQDNIGLPDSLLSRFDLLFIVLDQLDPALDRKLSEHVIKSHQYRRPGTTMEPEALNQASTLNLNDDTREAADAVVWQRGGKTGAVASKGDGRIGDTLTKDFLRKYVHYAKSRVQPALSEVAMEEISSAYVNMRSKQSQKNLPVTARSLETLIRLSSANAKARLSISVDHEDVEVACELINFVLFHDIGDVSGPGAGVDSRGNLMEAEKPRGQKNKRGFVDQAGNGDGTDGEDKGDEDDDDDLNQGKKVRRGAGTGSSSASASNDDEWIEESEEESNPFGETIEQKNEKLAILTEAIGDFSTNADNFLLVDFMSHLRTTATEVYTSLGAPSMDELITILKTYEEAISNTIMMIYNDDGEYEITVM